ncbi:hypothetical protein ABKV19_004350 [Rosa sericea]
MVMAHGCFFLFLIFFSSFISSNSILHAYASNQAQRNSLGLSSPPSSNRISINCRPGLKGITKCNHNDLAALTVVSDSDRPTKGTPGGRRSLGGGTSIGGVVAAGNGSGSGSGIPISPPP